MVRVLPTPYFLASLDLPSHWYALRRSWATRQLRRTLDWTFEVRDTHALPDALPPPASDWRPGYRKLAQGVGISEDIASGYQIASGFLNPVLGGQVSNDTRWEPESGNWRELAYRGLMRAIALPRRNHSRGLASSCSVSFSLAPLLDRSATTQR
jgi:hypothetical protein